MTPRSMDKTASRVSDLLPCPFCGKECERGSRKINPWARCPTEGCAGRSMPIVRLDDPEAITAWNTRSLSDSVSDGSTPLTETQIWALSRIDDQFAILGPATGDGQRMTEAERNDLIERKLVAQVPLELLEGLSQPNGHWTPEYMSEIRKKHGADTTALLRPSSAASLECIHSYYRSALDSGTGGQQPVALPDRCPHCDLHWGHNPPAIISGTDNVRCIECKTVFPTEPKAGVVSYSLADCKRLVEVVIEHCQGPDWDCDTKAAVKSLYAALNGDKP